MKPQVPGYRVAVVGASSLLGKELIGVLEERNFPVAEWMKWEALEDQADLPIVDLSEGIEFEAVEPAASGQPDFAFLAARPKELPPFLRATSERGLPPGALIDLAGAHERAPAATGGPGEWLLSVPFLEGDPLVHWTVAQPARFASPHPAAIVVASVLIRLAARLPLGRAVVQIFAPASEMGPRAIGELQKQTVDLLSFQKLPTAVFGAQLAFNLLPRLGHARRGAAAYHDALGDLEGRVRGQLRQYLGARVPLPALRLVQAPVFYSLAFSFYVETARPAKPEELAKALEGDRIHLRRLSDPAPSQVETTETSDILVDAITPEGSDPRGFWIWATADNMRLAATNAVEIAESLRGRVHLRRDVQ